MKYIWALKSMSHNVRSRLTRMWTKSTSTESKSHQLRLIINHKKLVHLKGWDRRLRSILSLVVTKSNRLNTWAE